MDFKKALEHCTNFMGNKCVRVIYDPRGKTIMKYAWVLGFNSNNQGEVLVVYMGMKLKK
jgi:hypothetical protein